MPRTTDARTKALATAERLFRTQGFAATGLTQIIEESGAPKGSFYFHFPRGKLQLAEEALDAYVERVASRLHYASSQTQGNATAFVAMVSDAAAHEMARSDFRLGCLVQNLANEQTGFDASLAGRLAEALGQWTGIAADHFSDCGVPSAEAEAQATTFVAALSGARTLARAQGSAAAFEAIQKQFVTS